MIKATIARFDFSRFILLRLGGGPVDSLFGILCLPTRLTNCPHPSCRASERDRTYWNPKNGLPNKNLQRSINILDF